MKFSQLNVSMYANLQASALGGCLDAPQRIEVSCMPGMGHLCLLVVQNLSQANLLYIPISPSNDSVSIVVQGDVLCLLEWERDARKLR